MPSRLARFFYKSISHFISDLCLASVQELVGGVVLDDPDPSVAMGIGESFSAFFPQEEYIHDWKFSSRGLAGNDCCACVVNLPNANSLDVNFCAVWK